MKESCTFVIFGAAGNLTKKKLIPSIYKLLKDGNLGNFAIAGVAIDKVSAQQILNNSKKYVKNVDERIWKRLRERFYYLQSDFHEKKKFCDLGPFVREIERTHKLSGNRIFYLATLPQHFKVIADNLQECGLSRQRKNWTRIVFEKPFGQDLKSAKKINACIKKVFTEKQIYRIDHYLGKELIQNISVARFTNTILEPLWSKQHIDHMQIILSEDVGIEERGPFYDRYGAIRDVMQNHMMQMLSLATMEAPKKMTGDNIRDEKVKILKKIRISDELVVGQYIGYTKEKGIPKNSKTETFGATKFFIDNRRWKGVPFYLITGKKMDKKLTSIYVQFKQAPCLMLKGICEFKPNSMVIQIQPKEGFYIQLNAKVPGKMDIAPVKMDFCHECTFGPTSPEAYENLFKDVMRGDQSVFVRTDEIEQQWRIIDKVTKKKPKINKYKIGTYPKQADKIIDWYLKIK